jgi:hypothetical protein
MQATPTGLEPATTGSTVQYSNQLSYGASNCVLASKRVLANKCVLSDRYFPKLIFADRSTLLTAMMFMKCSDGALAPSPEIYQSLRVATSGMRNWVFLGNRPPRSPSSPAAVLDHNLRTSPSNCYTGKRALPFAGLSDFVHLLSQRPLGRTSG